jgi:hypothetical protein
MPRLVSSDNFITSMLLAVYNFLTRFFDVCYKVVVKILETLDYVFETIFKIICKLVLVFLNTVGLLMVCCVGMFLIGFVIFSFVSILEGLFPSIYQNQMVVKDITWRDIANIDTCVSSFIDTVKRPDLLGHRLDFDIVCYSPDVKQKINYHLQVLQRCLMGEYVGNPPNKFIGLDTYKRCRSSFMSMIVKYNTTNGHIENFQYYDLESINYDKLCTSDHFSDYYELYRKYYEQCL